MKKILALTISSLVVTGAYADNNTRSKTTEQRVVVIDDNNRKAILAALGTTDEDSHAVASAVVTPVVEAPKPKVKTESITQTVSQFKDKVVSSVTPVPEKKTVKEVEKIIPAVNVENKPTPIVTQKVIEKVETKKVEVVNLKPESKNTSTLVTNAKIEPVIKKEIAPIALPKPVIPIEKEVKVESKVPSVVAKPILSNEVCEPVKKVVKPVVHKKITKKTVVKKIVKVSQPIELDFYKSPNSISEVPLQLQKNNYLTNQEVTSRLSYLKESNTLKFSISQINGSFIHASDFNHSVISAYLVNTDLNNMQKQNLPILDNQKDYLISLEHNHNCKALFVQYSLKGEQDKTTVVQYFDHEGNISNQLDQQCSKVNANFQDNLTYSSENDSTAIFMKDTNITSKKPVIYTIIHNKNGQTYIPATLKSFIVDKNLTKFYEVQPIEKNAINIAGKTYSQQLDKGTYYIVAQFPGVKTQQGVVIEANVN